MPGVTEQEIAQAKQMNLYQYMQLCEPDNFKPEGPGQFRHKGHSSLTFAEDGSWTYFKTKATGRTALNYLIAVEGVSFVEAVREINRIQGGVRPSFQPVKAPSPPAEKKPAKEFRLPKPDKNNYAATAYLRKRCIHPNVLTVCKQKKILYQTSFKDHPNCVFVGRDGNGEPKGGSLRGCSQIQFRRDIPGSKKIYPFYIEAAANADTVEVYEAPIDAMNAADRIVEKFPQIDSWYISGHSLGGAMAASYAAKHSDSLDGLVLLAAYSTADLKDSGLRVYTTYGSEDGVLNREKLEANRGNLPQDTIETVINGGCHAGFGSYGSQKGDGEPTISAEEQQQQTSDAVAAWIEQ